MEHPRLPRLFLRGALPKIGWSAGQRGEQNHGMHQRRNFGAAMGGWLFLYL